MHFSRRLLPVLLMSVAVSRCDCGEQLEQVPEPDVELRDPVSGKTNDDPRNDDDGNTPLVVEFGVQETGSRTEKTVEINNRGNEVLKVTRISFAPADAADPICPSPSANIKFQAADQQAPGEVEKDGGQKTVTLAFDAVGGSHCRILLVSSNDSDEPDVKVYFTASAQGPKLCAEDNDTGVIDFGTARPGTTKQKSQKLYSCGTRAVSVSALAIVDGLNSVFRIDAPATVPSGELPPCDGSNDATCSFTVDLTFAPNQGGTFQSTLNVTTTSPATGETVYPFQLMGKGAECNLTVTPLTVNFGAVASNGSALQTVLLRNSGVCHCQVDTITAIDPSDVGFSFESPPSTPFVLRGSDGCDGDPEPAAGATNTTVLQVKYAPGARPEASSDHATFHVQSASNTGTPDFTVNLEASGGGVPRCLLDVDPVLPAAAPTGGNPFGLAEGQDTYKRYGLVRFGNTTVNNVKKMPITLTNMGNANCEISGLTWDTSVTPQHHFGMEDAAGSPINVGGNPGLVIPPGEALVINATYSPTEAGEKWNGGILESAQRFMACPLGGTIFPLPTQCDGNGVRLTTNAENIDTTAIGGGVGVMSFGFNAGSVAPAIDVIPAELDFGLITLGCGSEEREVKIYNTGSADLVIANFTVVPTANPIEFRITAAPATPATVTPGSSVRVKVRFYPRRMGEHTANLVITADEGNSNYSEYTVPLAGQGTDESHVVDVFRQLTEPLVDVLWVVDDSGSMSDEQTALGQNFPQFFSQTSINNVNYHIAVTTTLITDDMCMPDLSNPNAPCDIEPAEMAGWYTHCNGNDKFITPSTSNPETQFSCNVQVSDASKVNPDRGGSDSAEAGLQAAKIFLSEPNITDPNINGGFMREDAKLYVIIVSDEEDQSEGPTDLYVDFFQNLKGYRNRHLVSVSAIAGHVPGGCGEQAQAGARYKDVVDALGNGIFNDICAGDFGNQLAALAFDSFGLKTQFFLTRGAEPSAISVCVSDNDVEANPGATCTSVAPAPEGSATGYFYEAASNSVVFNAGSVPARGQYIKVEYDAQCLPLSP